jgi:hypothetical protein
MTKLAGSTRPSPTVPTHDKFEPITPVSSNGRDFSRADR